MKFCKRCGKEIKSNALYCPYCGFNQSSPLYNKSQNVQYYMPKQHMNTGLKIFLIVLAAIFGFFVIFTLLGIILPPIVQLFQTYFK